MKPAKKIVYPDWIVSEDIRSLMTHLGAAQDDPMTMFVGGCVRNTLLDFPVSDIDIATIHTPEKVMEILGAQGIKVIPTGVPYGTVTAVIDGHSCEITTLRKDVETDGRRAVVAYTDSWEDDAQRRDFTINTLLMDLEGNIYDPTGRGLADISSRNIVFVGDAGERVREDYLRILRFFRFYGLYGSGAPDESALHACKQHAQDVFKLSRERVTMEIFKILGMKNAADLFSLMFSCGVLAPLFSRMNKNSFDAFVRAQHHLGVVNTVAAYVAMTARDVDAGHDIILLSKDDERQARDITAAYDALPVSGQTPIRRAVYTYGNKIVTQAYVMRCAEVSEPVNMDLLDIARYWRAPVFPVTGQDLMAQGYKQGPELGAALKQMEQDWILENIV